MKRKHSDPWIVVIFFAVFLIMLAFNILSPLVSDDYAFSFGVDGQRVASFSSIFEALSQHRLYTNGRVIAHFFVYLFLWLPKSIFNLVNAAVCTLCIWLLYRFWRSEESGKNRVLLITALCVIWVFLPGFGDVVLWLTGACNYLWGMVLFLLLVYQFYCVYLQRPCALAGNKGLFLQGIVCLPLAFFTGAYSENGGLAMIFLLICLILVMLLEKRKIAAALWITLIAFAGGFAFLMAAPAEIHGRTAELSLSSLFDSAKTCVLTARKFCQWLLCIYAAVLALGIVRKAERKKVIFSVILVLAGLVSVAVFVFAAYLPSRSFHVLVMFTILAILLLMDELWIRGGKEIPAAFCGAMVVLFAFSFVLSTGDIISLSFQADQRESLIEEAKASGNTEVVLPILRSSTPYTVVIEEQLSPSPDDWYNGCIASYYGLESVRAETIE